MKPDNNLPLPKDQPSAPNEGHSSSDPAVNIIRGKIDRLFEKEPAAKAEAKEITATGVHSKHQAFMDQLQNSGANQAQIQVAWHKYYDGLTDKEKRQVWREFYQHQSATPAAMRAKKMHSTAPQTQPKIAQNHNSSQQIKSRHQLYESVEHTETQLPQKMTTRQKIVSKANARGKLKTKHHLQSLLFGAGMGLAVLLIFMFGFFNERFIAPFITPSKTASASPIIIDPNSTGTVGPEAKLIIPKLNVEVPVVYNVASNEEKDIQKGLEDGVVHYPTTPVPGQKGNVSIVGHSSNNIFNPGKYKYVFTLLNKMQEGDTFFINYNGQRFVYKIYKKHIVKPSDVYVLGPQPEKESTATLITCDPPGTNVNRLVLVGEQVSPEPLKNIAGTTQNSSNISQPASVPGNSRSLFDRLFGRN